MTEYKTDPTVLKRGMPPEQRNGLYGTTSDRLVGLGVGERFSAVVTFEVADIRSSEADATQYPLVEMVHIEPVWTAEGIEAVRGAQEAEFRTRTGANQLNFEGLATDAPNDPDVDEQAERDAEFEAAAPKKTAAKK